MAWGAVVVVRSAVPGMPTAASVNLMGSVLVGVFEIAVAANFYRSTAVARSTEV